MLKRLVRQIIAAALYYSGLLALLDRMTSSKDADTPLVLMYHRVLPDADSIEEFTQAGITISTASFESQIAFLKDRYEVLSADSFLRELGGKVYSRKKRILITFDDGWRDNFVHAYPILKRHGVPATILVCAGMVGTCQKFWFHEVGYHMLRRKWSQKEVDKISKEVGAQQPLRIDGDKSGFDLLDAALGQVKFWPPEQIERLITLLRTTDSPDLSKWDGQRAILDWSEIEAMDPAIITIGSHGMAHRLLTEISESELLTELTESKEILEKKLRKSIEMFAYPNGNYSSLVKSKTAESGYKCAFAVRPELASGSGIDVYEIPRLGLHEGATRGVNRRFSKAIFAFLLSRARRNLANRRM